MNETKNLLGLARLMKMAFDGKDLSPLGEELIRRIEADPLDAEAMMDLSTLLQLKFQPEVALSIQAQALAQKTLYHLPAKYPGGIRLLSLNAPGDLMTNAPLEFLVEDSDISLHMLYVGEGLTLPAELPEHDVLFVAVGESDGTRQLLEDLQVAVSNWHCPVLNLPQNILKTSREAAPGWLSGVEGVTMPQALRVQREALADLPLPYPFIARPIGSHAGHGLAKMENANDLEAYLASNREPAFHVSPFVDYRSRDGFFRKYRVALIDGLPHACHMGISASWMIHYLNSGMEESAEKRAEEADFMMNFASGFGARHAAAFSGIHRSLGLDYFILDCAETLDGKLLVFEIDTGAVIHAMDPEDLFPYKAPQMRKVFAAFRNMLADHEA
ncbi:MAG: RimK family alpha-L-glutamate ligase [Burkholderiales bacterium]|nr:RimK family alpha-L-glutamate ligase [Burkholderiales bacterium]